MYRSYGLRLLYNYFFQNYLFDLINGLNTHVWLPNKYINQNIKNLKHGVQYQASWTKIIKETTIFIISNYEINLDNCIFYDVGCGKGKVLCVWSKLLNYNEKRLLVGLDFNSALIKIAKKNLKKIKENNYKLFNTDVLDYDFVNNKNLNIFYLYNPFDQTIMKKFVNKIKDKKCFIIYNHAKHQEIFINNKFKIIKEKVGWHPNANYIILSNINT